MDSGPRSEAADHDLKQMILLAIAAHLHNHGPRNWDQLRENPAYAHIIGRAAGEKGRRKFWRWVKSVSEPTPPDQTRPHETRDAAAGNAAWAQDKLASLPNLPFPVAPAFLMRTGRGGLQKLEDLALIVSQVLRDAQATRDAAFHEDGTVASGALVLRAGKQQLEVVSSALRLWREVKALMEQERLYEGLFRILEHELAFAPEVRARIVTRLQELFFGLGQPPQDEV